MYQQSCRQVDVIHSRHSQFWFLPCAHFSSSFCLVPHVVLSETCVRACLSQPNIVNSFAEQMQNRATCKMECAHQGHVNMSCAQEVHHKRDLQGAGQGSCTSVANLITPQVKFDDCAICLVIFPVVKLARKSRHHCPFGCFSSAVARVFRSRTMLPFLQGVDRRSTRRQVYIRATRDGIFASHSLCALACGIFRRCA